MLGDIAQARDMNQIARETGLGRESLYKALSPDGNPEFSTVLKVVRALGLRLRATAVDAQWKFLQDSKGKDATPMAYLAPAPIVFLTEPVDCLTLML